MPSGGEVAREAEAITSLTRESRHPEVEEHDTSGKVEHVERLPPVLGALDRRSRRRRTRRASRSGYRPRPAIRMRRRDAMGSVTARLKGELRQTTIAEWVAAMRVARKPVPPAAQNVRGFHTGSATRRVAAWRRPLVSNGNSAVRGRERVARRGRSGAGHEDDSADSDGDRREAEGERIRRDRTVSRNRNSSPQFGAFARGAPKMSGRSASTPSSTVERRSSDAVLRPRRAVRALAKRAERRASRRDAGTATTRRMPAQLTLASWPALAAARTCDQSAGEADAGVRDIGKSVMRSVPGARAATAR